MESLLVIIFYPKTKIYDEWFSLFFYGDGEIKNQKYTGDIFYSGVTCYSLKNLIILNLFKIF